MNTIQPKIPTAINLAIPPCPVSGLIREIYDFDMLWFRQLRQLIIDCQVRFYRMDGEVKHELTKLRQSKKLLASDSLVYVGPIQEQAGRFLTADEVNVAKNHDALLAKYAQDQQRYLQLLGYYETAHAAWEEVENNPLPEPQPPVAPTPVPDPLPCMEEFDFYSYVIGGQEVNVPALIIQTLQQRAFIDRKLEDVTA